MTQGEPERARQLYARALAIKFGGGCDHPDVAWWLANLRGWPLAADAGDVMLASRFVAEAMGILPGRGPLKSQIIYSHGCSPSVANSKAVGRNYMAGRAALLRV